jgi:hypothetical protein
VDCQGADPASHSGRRRLAITSARGHLLGWLKLIAPGLVDRLAARAMRERR